MIWKPEGGVERIDRYTERIDRLITVIEGGKQFTADYCDMET